MQRRRAITVGKSKPGSCGQFVVTGSGKCGTHFLAAVLNRLGIATGHEAVFAYGFDRLGWGQLAGDCSWPAAVRLAEVPPGTAVLHLVRDPLAVVNSRYGENKLGDSFSPAIVRNFVRRFLPEVFGAGDDLGRALRFVVGWNDLISQAHTNGLVPIYRRERVEDLAMSPDLLADIIKFLTGRRIQSETVRVALLAVPTSMGASFRRSELTWCDLRTHCDSPPLLSQAVDYGYEPG